MEGCRSTASPAARPGRPRRTTAGSSIECSILNCQAITHGPIRIGAEPLRLIAIGHDVEVRLAREHSPRNCGICVRVADIESDKGAGVVRQLTVGIREARVVAAIAGAEARVRAPEGMRQLITAIPIGEQRSVSPVALIGTFAPVGGPDGPEATTVGSAFAGIPDEHPRINPPPFGTSPR